MMSNLLVARSQMAMSLGFHILFAVAGMALPLFMVAAELRWLVTKDGSALHLAKRWAKGTAVLFAVGAVSGTVLSFELGLLWPAFMGWAGSIIGMPFSLEGFAFFTEAVFLGIYLYGWDRIHPVLHWLAGIAVCVSGTASGVFVVLANGWMNTPTGFQIRNGEPVDIDPLRAMLNPAGLPEALHMVLAAYAATAFVAMGIHAVALLKDRQSRLHRLALQIALVIGAAASCIQPLSGDSLAKMVAQYQPVKLASMEGQFQTERHAPLRLGGFPDEASATTRYSIEIPGGLSFLAYRDTGAVVRGLTAFPKKDWPPVPAVHVAFQIMVGAGSAMVAVMLWGTLVLFRRRQVLTPIFLKVLVLCSPLGVVALESGWCVTELGRQPWIIQGVMRTSQAVTPMPGLVVPFATFSIIYIVLGISVIALLRHQFQQSFEKEEAAPLLLGGTLSHFH